MNLNDGGARSYVDIGWKEKLDGYTVEPLYKNTLHKNT
jgi:hypothetical protein